MNAEQLERALEVVRELLDLLDRKWLQVSWREADLQVVEEARAFVAGQLVRGDLSAP